MVTVLSEVLDVMLQPRSVRNGKHDGRSGAVSSVTTPMSSSGRRGDMVSRSSPADVLLEVDSLGGNISDAIESTVSLAESGTSTSAEENVYSSGMISDASSSLLQVSDFDEPSRPNVERQGMATEDESSEIDLSSGNPDFKFRAAQSLIPFKPRVTIKSVDHDTGHLILSRQRAILLGPAFYCSYHAKVSAF